MLYVAELFSADYKMVPDWKKEKKRSCLHIHYEKPIDWYPLGVPVGWFWWDDPFKWDR